MSSIGLQHCSWKLFLQNMLSACGTYFCSKVSRSECRFFLSFGVLLTHSPLGVVFLFRVGLAIVQCCKQTVMKTPERDAVLNILLHPPALCLPANSEAFLEIAASVKLKDDDIRKQRTKLEARVKRQTQARAHSTQVITNGAPPSISLPRS